MARISFSPLIVSASGKVQDTVFSRWKGQPYIRSRVTPSNPQSTDQTKQRAIMSAAVGLWQVLAADIKAAWNTYASGYAISGYNACTKRNAKTAVPSGDGTYARLQDSCTLDLDPAPSDSAINACVGFAAVTGSGSSSDIDVTWTYSSYDSSDALYVFAMRDDAANGVLIPPTAALSAIPAHTGGTHTISGLDPAHTYSVYGLIYDGGELAWAPVAVDNTVSPKA